MGKYTPGPWRWELNERYKTIQLVGGIPQFDLTIIKPARWGMGSATLFIRDTAHDGLNLVHKLHERRDWVRPFEGREHHAGWCAGVDHPDMLLIAAAPDLLDAAQTALECLEGGGFGKAYAEDVLRAAIRKAEGEGE